MPQVLLKVEGMTRRFGGWWPSRTQLRGPRGRDPGSDRAQRRRQEHHVQCGQRYRCRPAGARVGLGGTSPAWGARIARQGPGTFQHDSLLREMTVYDNIVVGTFRVLRQRHERDARVRETAAPLG